MNVMNVELKQFINPSVRRQKISNYIGNRLIVLNVT